MVYNPNTGKDVAYAIFGFGFGIWSFFKGFKLLNEKRLIEDIPTSTVRGLAMGLVELNGKAKKSNILSSPLTGVECVFYRYTIERYENRGRSSSWVVIAKADSSYCSFCLDDGTGKIMVVPQGAEITMPFDYRFETLLGKEFPEQLLNFMESNGIKYRGFLGNYSLRFTEWNIMNDENIFVLGTAVKTIDSAGDHEKRLVNRLEAIKNDPKKMLELDLNKDGTISEEEWNKAISQEEQKLLEEELKSMPQGDSIDVVIGKGDIKQLFIISDSSQTQLTKRLSNQTILYIFGGAALTLVALTYLLFRFGPWIKL
jgi:hypothetical protein